MDDARALVVEDEDLDREETTAILRAEGYDVHAVRNGREALEALADGAYSLILLDILLPQVDGFDIMKHIRTARPELLNRTVVISRLAVKDMKIFFPVPRVYTKPIEPDALRQLAREARLGELRPED